MSHLFFMTAVALMITIPYRRLTGFWDNGLRWSKPEDKLRKYDNTSQFEKTRICAKLSVSRCVASQKLRSIDTCGRTATIAGS